jgi:hypothetical protein
MGSGTAKAQRNMRGGASLNPSGLFLNVNASVSIGVPVRDGLDEDQRQEAFSTETSDTFHFFRIRFISLTGSRRPNKASTSPRRDENRHRSRWRYFGFHRCISLRSGSCRAAVPRAFPSPGRRGVAAVAKNIEALRRRPEVISLRVFTVL